MRGSAIRSSVMSKEVKGTTLKAAGSQKRTTGMRSAAIGKTSPKSEAKAKGARSVAFGKARFEAVMKAVEKAGLLGESGRIGARVSAALIERAKQQTGIERDTDLIVFALANVALTDGFSEVFQESRGKVDPTLKLGY